MQPLQAMASHIAPTRCRCALCTFDFGTAGKLFRVPKTYSTTRNEICNFTVLCHHPTLIEGLALNPCGGLRFLFCWCDLMLHSLQLRQSEELEPQMPVPCLVTIKPNGALHRKQDSKAGFQLMIINFRQAIHPLDGFMLIPMVSSWSFCIRLTW